MERRGRLPLLQGEQSRGPALLPGAGPGAHPHRPVCLFNVGDAGVRSPLRLPGRLAEAAAAHILKVRRHHLPDLVQEGLRCLFGRRSGFHEGRGEERSPCMDAGRHDGRHRTILPDRGAGCLLNNMILKPSLPLLVVRHIPGDPRPLQSPSHMYPSLLDVLGREGGPETRGHPAHRRLQSLRRFHQPVLQQRAPVRSVGHVGAPQAQSRGDEEGHRSSQGPCPPEMHRPPRILR